MACADTLTVNTTTDDFQNNSLCSLREAVEFFNRGKPAGGFQGCESPATDASAAISLPADSSPYRIQGSAITVRTGLSITGAGRRDDAVTTLQVEGRHRAFVVNDNPQVKAPACGLTTPATCASAPATGPAPSFDLAPASDTGTVGDYLTTAALADVVGTLPGVSTLPLPDHSYEVRVYLLPEEGEPYVVGRTKVAFSAGPIAWQARVILPVGAVHRLTYSTAVVETATNAPVSGETDIFSRTLRVAVDGPRPRITLRLGQLIINGGCQLAAAADCANNVDDDSVLTNAPGAGYDAYALTYSNGLLGTAGKGGIIYSNERLAISDVLLRYGQANDAGGAVYLSSDAGLFAEDTEFSENRAVRGAAIYAERNSVVLNSSLLARNEVVPGAGPLPLTAPAVLEVGSATVPVDLNSTDILNTTLSGNQGLALSLLDGMVVNQATIVGNTGGIDFNSAGADVYNSVLAGNTGAPDCANPHATGTLMAANLLVAGGGCPAAGNQVIDGVANGPGQLMATEVAGKCAGDFGLLCPLADHGGATFVHMPRVLESYASIDASPIINKGSRILGSAASDCRSTDQRGESRTALSCDIGAVELQALGSGSATRTGGSISYGQTFTQFMGDDLGDEALLSAASCAARFPARVEPDGRRYPPLALVPDITRVMPDSYDVTVPGCPWVEMAPSRGRVTFSGDGNYNYKPSSDFHGFDRFDIRAVTSLSALNALPVDRSRLLKAQVIVEPGTRMTSDKLGGATDLWMIMLLALAGLGWRRGGKA